MPVTIGSCLFLYIPISIVSARYRTCSGVLLKRAGVPGPRGTSTQHQTNISLRKQKTQERYIINHQKEETIFKILSTDKHIFVAMETSVGNIGNEV